MQKEVLSIFPLPVRIKGLFKREPFCGKKNTLITLKEKSGVYFG